MERFRNKITGASAITIERSRPRSISESLQECKFILPLLVISNLTNNYDIYIVILFYRK